jgi:hypothetical protein
MMAHYKYGAFLQQENGNEYDTLHEPGEKTSFSGVYRCEGCGKSVTSIRERPLPPQNHHEHLLNEGRIRWRLVVKSHYVGGY